MHNFEIDFYKMKGNIAKELCYENMKYEFDYTYFSDALDLIYKKLSTNEYWRDSIKKVLKKYAEIEITRTFEQKRDVEEVSE